jgi:hypothetical protein
MTGRADLEIEPAGPFTDDELSALALAADRDESLDEDAVSFWEFTGDHEVQRLPEWYMPSPKGVRLVHGWRRNVVLLIIVSFLVIDAYGLCNTYGWVHFG